MARWPTACSKRSVIRARRAAPAKRRQGSSMQVIELAEDLRVETDALVALLRKMGIPVSDEQATITDGQKAKVLAKVERERRSGHKDPAAAVRAALEESASSSSRRRRRRRADTEPAEAEAEAEPSDELEAQEEPVMAGETSEPEAETQAEQEETPRASRPKRAAADRPANGAEA